MPNQLNFVDLFAGGGGLSEGFIQEGCQPIAHVEADAAACNTLRTRMAYHWLVAAGREDLYADYLTGGISRDEMYVAAPQRVVQSVINDEIRPGTLGQIYREIDSLLKGRELALPPLGAGEGGVAPCRRLPYESSWQVEAGVSSPLPEWNERRSRLRYGTLPPHLKTHRNKAAFTDRFKVVAGDLPFAHTVVAHICRDGYYYIHPDIAQNRSITPREAARLQTFPDDYYFEGVGPRPSRTHAFRQIGNAVPVLLSRGIAARIRQDWDA